MTLFDTLGRPDPTPWLLASDEPQARWVALAHLVPDAPPTELAAAHDAVLAHPATHALLDRLPASWDVPVDVGGHNKPELPTNLLDLLADVGVTEADDPRITALLDGMLQHADSDGRFLARFVRRDGPPAWGCVHCDTHAIADILGRYGRAADPRVRGALHAAESDLEQTSLGLAWGCRPDPATGFRGPGRVGDPCPQATLEALRAFSWLLPAEPSTETSAAAPAPPAERAASLSASPSSLPAILPELVHTTLETWRRRGVYKPYMMGHGRQFKQVKWPATWYGAYEIVDVLGRSPETWRHNAEDRRSLAEIAACLVAYNIASDGRVTPLSTFKGWEMLSLGQKKEPSPLATALVWSRLKRLTDAVPGFAQEIAEVDVMRLGSSKGGSGTPMPPKVG